MHNPASVQANCFVATQAQRNADKLLKNITSGANCYIQIMDPA